jgi:hypothetical protein
MITKFQYLPISLVLADPLSLALQSKLITAGLLTMWALAADVCTTWVARRRDKDKTGRYVMFPPTSSLGPRY